MIYFSNRVQIEDKPFNKYSLPSKLVCHALSFFDACTLRIFIKRKASPLLNPAFLYSEIMKLKTKCAKEIFE